MKKDLTASNITWIGLAILSQLGDVVSTIMGLSIYGVVECNPFMGLRPSLWMLLFEKQLMFTFAAMVAIMITEAHLRDRLFMVLFVLGCGATVWNLAVINFG